MSNISPRSRRGVVRAMVCAPLMGIVPLSGRSEGIYPNKPIHLIAPFGAGGATDTIARLIGQKLSSMGQPVIVENRVGAGGNIGTTAIARAEPDGYTLGIGTPGALVVNRNIFATMPFDTTKDISPIALLCDLPSIMLVSPSAGLKTLTDLVQKLKANPNAYSYSSAGVGTASHTGMELFLMLAGIPALTHIPYKSTADAVAALLAGHVQLTLDTAAQALTYVNAGSALPLAVSSETRLSAAPSIPSLTETYPDFGAATWVGLIGPAKIPAAIQDKIAAECARILSATEVQESLLKLGGVPKPSTPAVFRAFLANELERWPPIIKKLGLKPV